MSCENCTQASPIPACVNLLTIGTISDALTQVYVVIEDVTQGRRMLIESTSNDAGLVTIDTSGFMFAENHSYIVYIVETIGGTSIDFTVDSIEYECLGFRANKLRNEAGVIIAATTHTLTKAA